MELRIGSRATLFKYWPIAVNWGLSALLFAGATLSVIGCEHVRRVTYPPDFTYLTDDTVSSSIGQMAQHVARLEMLLEDVQPGAPWNVNRRTTSWLAR